MTASGNHSAYEKNLPLFIERILLEHTDEDHAIGVTAISKELLRLYGINTSTDTVRKTLKSMADGYSPAFLISMSVSLYGIMGPNIMS